MVSAMEAPKKKRKRVASDDDQPVMVDEEHWEIIDRLLKKYGTRKNVVANALELLDQRDQAAAKQSPSMTG